MLRSAPRVSAHTTHRRMAQAPGNGAGAKNGARHPPLAPSPSAEKRTHQPPVFLGGVSGEYDFPGASAGALYDGFHPGGTPIPVTAASAYRSPTTTGDPRTAEDATSRRASQLKRCRGAGFIAALDQSGGSTPRALSLYGIDDIRADDKDAMFDAVHGVSATRPRKKTNRDVPVGRQRYRPVPQDRQRFTARSGRRAAHEADPGAGPDAVVVRRRRKRRRNEGSGVAEEGARYRRRVGKFYLFPRMGNWFDVVFLFA